ncbi:MAG: hypothetical protein AB1Z23_09930 [Eubacteriales bacterium]
MRKKLFTAFFVVLFVTILSPIAAMAADYDIDGQATVIIPAGTHRVFDSNPSVEATQIICSSSATILTIDNIDIDLYGVLPNPVISFTGAGNQLVIVGDNFLHAGSGCAAVSVEAGTSLTIRGAGYLEAVGGDQGAGIGSGNSAEAGTIIINSGTIAATNEGGGAGIGGGLNQSGGSITINGGTIYCETIFLGGAGIGGGAYGSSGNITINGGIIDILSDDGAAIGGGAGASGDNILITGGNIYSDTFGPAAGLGGGTNGSAGNIRITGGTTDCLSENGAGIGSGAGAGSGAGTIEITGGRVYGYSDYEGAGIGGGNLSSLTSITITGGTVVGSSEGACGIGAGANSSGGSISISGNALVHAWGDAVYPDIGDSLSSFVISGYSEVFLGEGILYDTPTTSHTYEPGSRIAGPSMVGVSNAYNFSAPQIPANWELNSISGYFIRRPVSNPQTETRGSDYLLMIMLTSLLALAALLKYYFSINLYNKF